MYLSVHFTSAQLTTHVKFQQESDWSIGEEKNAVFVTVNITEQM